jgi:hypothetical protein
LIARVVAGAMPDTLGQQMLKMLLALAHRIAENREIAGLHYRQDTMAGRALAKDLAPMVLRLKCMQEEIIPRVGDEWKGVKIGPPPSAYFKTQQYRKQAPVHLGAGQPVHTEALIPAGYDAGPMDEEVSLLAGFDAAKWVVREQAGSPSCVAEAVTACVELVHALNNPRMTTFSARFVDERLRKERIFRISKHTDACNIDSAWSQPAKLSEAENVLKEHGICPEADYDEKAVARGQPPSDEAKEAKRNKYGAKLYLNYPPPKARDRNLARMIYLELKNRRPVAIALPGFRKRGEDRGPTSWDRAEVWRTGIVPDPNVDDEEDMKSGHAVCVVGFVPKRSDRLDDYFIFRNSWGYDFGRDMDDLPKNGSIPLPPMPGYGVISATHVNKHCWEVLSLSEMRNEVT